MRNNNRKLFGNGTIIYQVLVEIVYVGYIIEKVFYVMLWHTFPIFLAIHAKVS